MEIEGDVKMIKLTMNKGTYKMEIENFKLDLRDDIYLDEIGSIMQQLDNLDNHDLTKVLAFLENNASNYDTWDYGDLELLQSTDNEYKVLYKGIYDYSVLGKKILEDYGDDINICVLELLELDIHTPINSLTTYHYAKLGEVYIQEFRGCLTSYGFFISTYDYNGKGLF